MLYYLQAMVDYLIRFSKDMEDVVEPVQRNAMLNALIAWRRTGEDQSNSTDIAPGNVTLYRLLQKLLAEQCATYDRIAAQAAAKDAAEVEADGCRTWTI